MKALIASLLAALSVSLVSAEGENKPLACQTDERGGLKWENGRWVVVRFVAKKFILVSDGKTLTDASVTKALATYSATCSLESEGHISCADGIGGYLLYDPLTSKGAYSQLFGGISSDGKSRDTLSVSPFTCVEF